MDKVFVFLYPIALIILICVIVSAVKKGKRKKRSICHKCKTQYTSADIAVHSSPLKFRKKEHVESVGDAKFSRWETIFYRDVLVSCTCPQCGSQDSFIKSIDVYSSDDTYSQSDAQEYALLKEKIAALFVDEIFKNKEHTIKIHGIDE